MVLFLYNKQGHIHGVCVLVTLARLLGNTSSIESVSQCLTESVIQSFNFFFKAEDSECRLWMLREECLDETINKLTHLLSCKDMCTASNAALVLARY